MADPWTWWDADTICRITKCPSANVAENWPLIADALDRRGIYTRNVARGVIGTVAIETASSFKPIDEFPDWGRYPNTGGYAPHYGGGPRFHGRGYVQLTHLSGYQAASEVVGVDLAAAPERANEPMIAAEIIGWWFATKGVPAKTGTHFYTLVELCEAEDWEWVRRAVQGGTNGLDRLISIANGLGGSQPMPTPLPYNPDAPIDAQPNDWSCALQSAQWLLRSIGRNPDASDPVGDPWLTSQLVPAIISPQVGLQDASGQQLADWINREYGSEMGFTAHAAPVTFDDVAAGAGLNPTLIGGRRWNHWSGVRALRSDGALRLANPADGWMGVGQMMTRQQFDNLGPFTAIWIDRAGAAVEPEPVPFDRAAAAARVRALLTLHEQYDAAIRAELSNLLAMLDAA